MRPVLAAFLVLLCLAAGDPSNAQSWPQRPVRLVVPYAAGGNSDMIARLLAQRLSAAFGQPFVVENRGGAGGAIAADLVAKSQPDGYTLCVCAMSQLAPVPLTQTVAYDPLTDFSPIANIGANGFVLAVSAKIPVTSLAGFIAYVKAHPGELNYGSGGTGSMTQLAALLFLHRLGLTMTHVPYKGGAPALTDTLAGQVDMYAASPSEVLSMAGTDRIRLLGISSDRRIKQLPDVPTIAEVDPGFRALTWNGLLGPARLPADIVDRLAAEIARTLADPLFVERLVMAGVEPATTTPEQFAAEIRDDYALWRDVIRRAGIVAQ